MLEIRQGEGIWVAEVSWRDRNGRRVSETNEFVSKTAAVTWAQTQDACRAGAERDEMTVAQLVLGWHDDRLPHLRDTTAAREEDMLMYHIGSDRVGAMTARSVTRRDAADFAERLKLKDNGRGAALAPKTRRHIQKAVRQAFDASWEIEINPFTHVALPPLPDTEAMFLSASEIDNLLKGADLHRWGWVFALLVLTGLRRSEFCGLRWQDVDLDSGHLDVKWRRTTVRSTVVEGALKTRRARRRIPLDPMAKRMLTERRRQLDAQRLEWGPDWDESGDEYVWAHEDGSLPHPNRLTTEFDRFCGRLAITSCGIHGLRHSFAAAAIAAGVAGYSLSRLMGHSQVTFTYSVYGHLFNDGLQGEMAKVSDLLGTSMSRV